MKLIKRLILFLVRKRLGLKKNEYFRFDSQKSNTTYYFTDKEIWKIDNDNFVVELSGVSLNWLLNDDCKIIKEA